MHKISAVLLAAGLSTRMGGVNKLFLKLNGKVLIDHCIEKILASRANELIIVSSELTHEYLSSFESEKVRIAKNLNYQLGMTSSIQSGIENAEPTASGFLVCLGDLPLIETRTFNQIIDSFQNRFDFDPDLIVKPYYLGKPGHPVLFSKNYRKAILNHREREGCKGIIEDNKKHLITVNTDDEGIILDVDRPEDFEKIKVRI